MTNRDIKKQMRKNLLRSYKGWYHWHKLTRKYPLSNTAVVLLPSKNRVYNYCALLYLDQMLAQRNFSKALILSVDPVASRAARLFSDKLCGVEVFPRKKAEELMQYYCLYEFDPRFFVASLEEPGGRNARRLIGKKGMTVEELMAVGVYGLYPFVKRKHIIYKGNVKEIKAFMEEAEYGD